MSAMLGYPVEFEPDDNGMLLATCPDLPEVVTFGEDRADAVLRAADAILTMLAAFNFDPRVMWDAAAAPMAAQATRAEASGAEASGAEATT